MVETKHLTDPAPAIPTFKLGLIADRSFGSSADLRSGLPGSLESRYYHVKLAVRPGRARSML